MIIKKFITITVILTIVTIFSSCAKISTSTSGNEEKKIDEKSLNIFTVREGDFSIKISGTGVLVPAKTISLYFKDVSGPLAKLNVELYDRVNKNDIIAEILPGTIAKSIEQQELALQKLEINKEQLDLYIDKLEKSIKDSQLSYNYTSKLSEIQPVKNQEYIDKTELELENQLIQLNEAKQNKILAEEDIEKVNEQIKKRKYELNNSILDLRNSLKKLDILEESAIDKRSIHLDRDTLNRALQSSETELNELLSGNSLYEYTMNAAIERKNQAEQTIVKLNNIIVNTKTTLNQTERANMEKLEEYEYNLTIGYSNLEKLNIELKTLRNSLLVNEIDQKIGNMSLENLQLKLENTKLTSPVDGIITYVADIYETDLISSNWVLARIASPEDIVLQFTSGDLSYFEKDMLVSVAFNGNYYSAEVFNPKPGELIKPIEGLTNTQIYLKMSDDIDDIELGIPMQVSLETEKKTDVIVVPKSAIRTDGNSFWVEVYKDGNIIKNNIQKGLESVSEVEIINGLQKGDKIVLSY